MAYREFHNEKYYEAPDVGIVERGLGKMNETIADIMRAASEEKKKKALAADQFKFDLGKGSFETDDKIFFQRGQNITARTRNDLKQYGSVSQQVQSDTNQSLMDKSASDWQYKAMTDMTGEIAKKEKDDTYYDSTHDYKTVKNAAYGENNDVYYTTRGTRLEEASKQLFKNPNSLKGKLYTADYVKTFGKKETTKAGENPNSKSSTYTSTPFITPAGVPGVTVDHAKQYLNSRSDGSVARWVENMVDQKMMDEVKLTKEKNSNLKGMSDQDALLYLKAHPEENVANKTMYSDRVISEAQREMLEAADLNYKTDYETKVDKTITNGLYSNDYVGQSDTNHVDDIGSDFAKSGHTDVSADVVKAIGSTVNNMPGGNLRIAKGAKTGQAIPLEVNPQYMVNTRNGKMITSRGSTQLNLTGYQLSGYTVDGKPRMLSPEQINNMSPSQFKNMAPSLGIALRGYTLNQGNKLGELASRQSDLDNKLALAVQDNDIDAQEAINDQIVKLKDLRDMLNLSPSEVSEEDLMSAYKQNGINVSNIKQDMIVKPSNADLALIDKNLTRGLDLTNQQKWSDDMRQTDALYRKRYNEAAAKGFKDDPAVTQAQADKIGNRFKGADGKTYKYPEVTSQAAYDKMPSGSVFIYNGKKMKKP